MSGLPRETNPPPPARLPATVVLLGFTSLFTDVGTEMLFPLLPLFLVGTLGASPAYVGLVEGAANTVASFLKLASGLIADRTARRKPLVLFGYGLASAVRPFIALATQPWHVLLVRVTDRVGKGIRGSPRDALIADAAGDRAGRAFGFHQAMDNAGAVCGPLLAMALLRMKVPIRDVFWVAVVPGAIATGLVALVREPPSAAPAKPKAGAAAEVAFDRTLIAYLGIVTLFALGNSSDAFLLLRAGALGVPTAEIPMLWSVLNLSKVFWAWAGGSLADRLPRARLVIGGWVVYAAVYVGLGLASATWHVWVLFASYGIFYGLTEPVEKALISELVAPSARGRAFGVYNFAQGVTTLPASLLTGMLWKLWGPAAALETGAAIAALACAALVGWDAWRARIRAATEAQPSA